jgi:serine/threonine protein kinase
VFDGILNRAPLAPVRLNPALSPKLEENINKALEKDRKLRYQSAAEMAVDLRRLQREIESGRTGSVSAALSSASSLVTPTTVAEPSAQATKSRAKWIALSGLIAAVLLLAAYVLRPTLPAPRITGYTQLTHDGLPKVFSGQTSNRRVPCLF